MWRQQLFSSGEDMVYRQVINTQLEQQLGFPSMPCTSWVGPESNKWAVEWRNRPGDCTWHLVYFNKSGQPRLTGHHCSHMQRSMRKVSLSKARKISSRQEKRCLMEFVCMLMYVSNGDLHFYFRAFCMSMFVVRVSTFTYSFFSLQWQTVQVSNNIMDHHTENTHTHTNRVIITILLELVNVTLW